MRDRKVLLSCTIFVVYFLVVCFTFSISKPKILYISSYSLRYYISMGQLNGIKEIFNTSNSDLTVEYLNTKKYPFGEIHDQIEENLLAKLRDDFDYDGVIVSDDNALRFVDKYFDELFHKLPVVFFGVNNTTYASKVAHRSNVWGLIEEASIYDNLSLMRSLYPDDEIAVIGDGTPEGAKALKKVNQFSIETPLTVINLDNLSWDEFSQKIKEFDRKPLLVISAFRDKKLETKFLDESLKLIKENHSGAIFVILDNVFEYSEVLGGKVISHFTYAREAAEMLYETLKNDSISFSGLAQGSNRLIIDYLEMQRLGLKTSQFPIDTIFTNKPQTVWMKYRFAIIILSLVIIGGYFLAIYLLFQIKSKNAISNELFESKEQLKKSKEELRRIIDFIPSHIYIKDSENKFLLLNKATASSFNCEPSELEGKNHFDLHENLDEIKGFIEEDRKILSGEVDEIIQYYNPVTIQGKTRYFQTTKLPYEIENGEKVVLGISTEITENVLMQKELEKKNSEILKRNQEIIDTQKDVIEKLGDIIENRSQETANHVKRVSKMAALLAEKYGLAKKLIELIEVSVSMHDVGKIAVKEEILHKPGKLTVDEYEDIKLHTKIGYNLLKGSKREIFKTAAIIAHEHHERWDGTGYPEQKKEKEIHIFGRITSIVDVFDALVTERSYKRAWTSDEAFEFIKNQRGKMFDPKLVDLFINNRDEVESIRDKYSN